MDWTQPCCDDCYIPYVYGVRGEFVKPVRMKIPQDPENCVFCKASISDPIYIRVDPTFVHKAMTWRTGGFISD